MKTKLLLLSIALMNIITITSSKAQQSDKVIITGSRFTYPLFEKWIAEYKKTNPAASIKINPRGGNDTDSANLIINAHELSEKEIKPGYKVVNINRYVLLTVANQKSDFSKQYTQTGIREKDVKKLFFEEWDPYEEETEKKKKKAKKTTAAVLYTREITACAPTTFARHYGYKQKDIVGKGIAGDDKHLIYAVLKDTNGVTYNNLGLIYDLKTRKVKDGLTVIPQDLNGNGKLEEEEQFYSSLDNVIARVEDKDNSNIVIGNVNLSFPATIDSSNKELFNFISWILNEGVKYNHEFGFLDLEPAHLNKQVVILNSGASNTNSK
jgi:phosphate transport system substrate-binding protein